MSAPKYFICKHCGNVIEKLNDVGVPVVCCGEAMHEMVPGTTDAALEKHVPVVSVEGDTVNVSVGSVLHPMEDAHSIRFIWLETEKGGQRRALSPGEVPSAQFVVAPGDKPVAVYEWCNLHGVWKTEI